MAWTNVSKDVERSKPFHRINSPWFKGPGESSKLVTLSSGQQGRVVGADGRGYECGCRSVEDFPKMGFFGEIKLALLKFIGEKILEVGDPKEVIHTLPGWVPVLNRNPLARVPPDDVDNPTQVEFEGTLVRSYQTWTDAPATQWHHWYDWNFLVVPRAEEEKEGGYAYLRGKGNSPPRIDKAGFVPLVRNIQVMELEWDCAAISAARPGAMFDGLLIKPDGSVDKDDDRWFWPMTGHFVWASGRWIYDCGHSNPPDDKEAGLMRTELHPIKALASARWEAVKFEENTHFVSAIQFMFLVHRKVGYKDWRTINDIDYEFIVDLPELNLPQQLDWEIGHTPEFPFNTGALRTPHLLKKVRFMDIPTPFLVPGRVMPIVEPIKTPDADPNLPPKQVKVTVPCKKLPKSADYYGFVLSLGWHDPLKEQARRVKKVSVFLDHFNIGDERHDLTFFNPTAEWQLRVGVNGRWMETILYEGVKEKQTRDIEVGAGKQFVEFHLADDDELIINAHGVEFDPVGNFLREKSLEQRKVRKNGVEAQWEKDIVIKAYNRENDDEHNQNMKDTISAISDLMLETFGFQNDPLGMIDPGFGPAAEQTNNPLTMKRVNEQNGGKIEDQTVKLTAPLTEEVGKLAELAEKPGSLDYQIFFTLNVAPQKLD